MKNSINTRMCNEYILKFRQIRVNELTVSNCLPHNDDSLLAEACKLQNNTELLTVEKKADIVETGFETCQERSE